MRLDDDKDFSAGHYQKSSGHGLVDKEQAGKDPLKYNYVTTTFLRKTKTKGSSDVDLSVAELNALLWNRKSIPCKVVITAYGYKPYCSNTMNIPSADLLRKINKPRSN